MVELLMKGAPLIIMVGGGYEMAKKSPDLLNFTKKTVAQAELNEMAKFIQLSSIDGLDSLPTPENFSQYLKTNMRIANADTARDVSRDHWEHPYRLIRINNALVIISDGADGKPDTSDDVRARVNLF